MSIGERKLSGGGAIVEAARANGMTTLFGVPGAQIYPLFDALYGTDVALIVPRHEQAAAYMAMGYAKSTGKPGVFSVVPGPGVLNASAALCTAMGNCAPVVCLTGQVPSSFVGRGRGLGQCWDADRLQAERLPVRGQHVGHHRPSRPDVLSAAGADARGHAGLDGHAGHLGVTADLPSPRPRSSSLGANSSRSARLKPSIARRGLRRSCDTE